MTKAQIFPLLTATWNTGVGGPQNLHGHCPSIGQTVPPQQMPDYNRVGNAMRIKMVDGSAD